MAPFDPGVRAARVGGLIFGKWELRYNAIQVHAEEAGISRMAGVLMGKILVFLQFPPVWREPPLYTTHVLRNSVMPGPLTPRHKGTVCGDDETPLKEARLGPVGAADRST